MARIQKCVFNSLTTCMQKRFPEYNITPCDGKVEQQCKQTLDQKQPDIRAYRKDNQKK